MSTKFDHITFNQTTQELTIKNGTATVAGPFDLYTDAVKLTVTRAANGDLEVVADTGTFTSEKMETKMRYSGRNKDANLLFGTLEAVANAKLDHAGTGPNPFSEDMGVAGDYSFIIIGCDDIRNNNVSPPKQLLLLEGETVSFDIVDEEGSGGSKKTLIVRYH